MRIDYKMDYEDTMTDYDVGLLIMQKYPSLFNKRNVIEIPPLLYGVFIDLCEELTALNVKDFEFLQVKMKFWEARIYFSYKGSNEEQEFIGKLALNYEDRMSVVIKAWKLIYDSFSGKDDFVVK